MSLEPRRKPRRKADRAPHSSVRAQQQSALLLVQRPAQRVYALGEFRLGIQIDVTLFKKMIHKNYSFCH